MLTGQTFLVTGGTRGIGKATVTALFEAGANVGFTYQSNKEAADELCSMLGEKDRILAIHADAQDFSQAKLTIEKVKDRFKQLHGVIINAGITKDKSFYLMNEEDWDATMQVNLKGTFNYARAAIYDFMKQKYGRIVCVSSVSGIKGIPGQANYSTTKAGQIGFVKTLAKEVSRYGITVNAVAPGFIETDMWRTIPDNHKDKILQEIPLGRVGEPSEVADAICFLLKSSYITGSVITVDGGLQA